MAISKTQFDNYIKNFNFYSLFNELGWDNDSTELIVPVKDNPIIYKLNSVAQKSNFKIFTCDLTECGLMPDYKTRKAIGNNTTKQHLYHLIIYFDKNNKKQIWQYTIREADKPDKVVYFEYNNEDSQKIYTKLRGLFFDIDEEEKITIIDVTNRFYENFNKNYEKVTKQFYDRFKKEHAAFINFITGIDDDFYKTWYASLMLNRLMFCYFIQKKGFLDNNFNYLKDKLEFCKNNEGDNRFYSFYKKFLLVLFHDGLGSNTRNEELKKVLGNIPYLNGGLFDEHEIEKIFTDLDIKDEAFERIFDFFDQYDWHLDTRPNTNGREINPDVIGYIFEKYINDRAEMGAYYTKEDITEYISKNCIIPFLFEKTKKAYSSAFNTDGEIWQMLKDSGDRYIYDAVKKGVDLPLPAEIAVGINPELENKLVTLDEPPKLLELRKEWNKPTPEEYALPTEIWRETIERRNRYQEILDKIENGEITDINDFITYNLNIRQFAQDVIENSNDPKLIKELYKCIYQITVLDPTCGSGAFLFAALNVLEPLYEALIDRMKFFVEEAPKGKYLYFEKVLININEQPNIKYFIYKSIIINNLYGVDIMKEATEIAKLRLFLKLVSVIDKDNTKTNMGLVPLPDIDFNIRSGNTLVGFINKDEINLSIEGLIDFDSSYNEIISICDVISSLYDSFRQEQLLLVNNSEELRKHKQKLHRMISELNNKLNLLIHNTINNEMQYVEWEKIYKPFNWFVEFNEIINKRNGFDVVIGNPPYVVYSNKTFSYRVYGYETLSCSNLFAFVVERSFLLMKKKSRFGMILPNSSIAAAKMKPLQSIVKTGMKTWVSNYAWRPSKLFDGADMLLSIILVSNSTEEMMFTTKYNKWYNNYRGFLFPNIKYNLIDPAIKLCNIPKLPEKIFYSIFQKITNKSNNKTVKNSFYNNSEFKLFYFRAVQYWIKILEKAPYSKENDRFTITGEMKPIYFLTENEKYLFISIFSSSLFFTYYITCGSCQVINNEDFNFPFDIKLLSDNNFSSLVALGKLLQLDLNENSNIIIRKYDNFRMEKQHFYIKHSKHIIDKIDLILANHFELTEHEIDFIINYDVKYRMGNNIEEDD